MLMTRPQGDISEMSYPMSSADELVVVNPFGQCHCELHEDQRLERYVLV